jgi:hypothetical protein
MWKLQATTLAITSDDVATTLELVWRDSEKLKPCSGVCHIQNWNQTPPKYMSEESPLHLTYTIYYCITYSMEQSPS